MPRVRVYTERDRRDDKENGQGNDRRVRRRTYNSKRPLIDMGLGGERERQCRRSSIGAVDSRPGQKREGSDYPSERRYVRYS